MTDYLLTTYYFGFPLDREPQRYSCAADAYDVSKRITDIGLDVKVEAHDKGKRETLTLADLERLARTF